MEGTKYIQSYEVDYSNVNFDQLREIDPDFTSKEEATNYDQIIQSLLMPVLQELTNHKLIERISYKMNLKLKQLTLLSNCRCLYLRLVDKITQQRQHKQLKKQHKQILSNRN